MQERDEKKNVPPETKIFPVAILLTYTSTDANNCYPRTCDTSCSIARAGITQWFVPGAVTEKKIELAGPRHRRTRDRFPQGQFNRLHPPHQRIPIHTNTHHLPKLWDQNHFSTIFPNRTIHPATRKHL